MSSIILPRGFRQQPQYPAGITPQIVRPDAVLLPSAGLGNAGGKSTANWTATIGISRRTRMEGIGFVPATGSDGVYIPSDASASGHKFSVLMSFVPSTITDSRGVFQWAGSTPASGSPYALIRLSPSQILSVFYGGGYRISSRINLLVADRQYNVVLRADGTAIRLYANGELLGTYTGSGGSATRTHAWFGNGYIGSLLDSATLLGAVWNDSDIGEHWAWELSNNPWSLFQGPRRRLWTEVSGGTSHNLITADPAQGNAAGTGAITQAHALATANATQANLASGEALMVDTEIALTASACEQANPVSDVQIGQTHVLVISTSTQTNNTEAIAVTQACVLTAANVEQANVVSAGAITTTNNLIIAALNQLNSMSGGKVTTTQILTIASATQANRVSSGHVSNGIFIESALVSGIAATVRIKKPGIPAGTPEWLRTLLEILIGRRGNKITPIAFRELTFSATPTGEECEALYEYMNKIRTALNDIIIRLDS